jgi:hypothetical protein
VTGDERSTYEEIIEIVGPIVALLVRATRDIPEKTDERMGRAARTSRLRHVAIGGRLDHAVEQPHAAHGVDVEETLERDMNTSTTRGCSSTSVTHNENADERLQISHSVADRSHDDSVVGEVRHRTYRTEKHEQIDDPCDGPHRGRRAASITQQFARHRDEAECCR